MPIGCSMRGWRRAIPAERRRIYVAFQQVMSETVPSILLFSPNLVSVAQARVRNYVQHPTGWWFGLAKTWLAA